MYKIDQRIVIVTRKTRQEELTAKFGTKGQAQFYVSRSRSAYAGKLAEKRAIAAPGKALKSIALAEKLAESEALGELQDIEKESASYGEIVGGLRQEMDFGVPVQVVDRALVPNLVFGPKDVVVAIGQDGLVANVAKYALGLPIVGVNPDPAQYDGVLLPFEWRQARAAVRRALDGKAKVREVTLAEARLADSQRLLAFNDLFIGARTHVSARYRIQVDAHAERQSSSGILVSTGAGSTGWLSSVLNMARGVMALGSPKTQRPSMPMTWEDRKLAYVVREPFASKSSAANVVAGMLKEQEQMTVESFMGPEGVIFSDGVEADALPFAQGAIATIGVAKEKARLVVG